MGTSSPSVVSPDIHSLSLHRPLPTFLHVYVLPFIFLYPFSIYAYYLDYDRLLGGEEWTFVLCVLLFGGHALSWLGTRWSIGFRASGTCLKASSLSTAQIVRVNPNQHRGSPELCDLKRELQEDGKTVRRYYFNYQKDKYSFVPGEGGEKGGDVVFQRLSYPTDTTPPPKISKVKFSLNASSSPSESEGSLSTSHLTPQSLSQATQTFGANSFDIPVPSFKDLFVEQAQAPFFVFQVFCVGLWCVDEYWYYSLFTLGMLIVFECTVVWQRLRTINEFRTMSIKPYPIQVYRLSEWITIQTDALLPGDIVSITRPSKSQEDSIALPCDLLLLKGTCIVNEAMLSGESTPLLKESVELRDGDERLDLVGGDRNSVLFGGTKVLQSGSTSAKGDAEEQEGGKKTEEDEFKTPDGGCLALVLRTGFGTSQGQLIRTMIFSTERVTANNMESFLFIAFLLVFAIAASWYVWTKGIQQDRKKSKLLLDCVLIITSVVPPELPMELSMAVNASLVALSKYAIFCTEPFRIPFAGRVDVCCFDKTGTITSENLVVEGVTGTSGEDLTTLVPPKEAKPDATLCLASAHALVLLEDGTIVGDPMEKTALQALDWKISAGDIVTPASKDTAHKSTSIEIRRRFQFSSALKRMSTVSTVSHPSGRRTLASVKGAPETLSSMYVSRPENYETTYKHFAQTGSRVLALGYKWMDGVKVGGIKDLKREEVEGGLIFAGFLVFNSPLKPDAVDTLKMLADSSHRCIMITGDNPLTAVHVAKDVEIVDREAIILDVREGSTDPTDLVWRTVDESKIISVDPKDPIDPSIWKEYDICMTGVALKQYEGRPGWQDLVQHTWVYARVSPTQKEYILTTLKGLGYVTLMAGDGTNDVGALKQAHIGVALLDGSQEDLKKIAEHQKNERMKKVYESQLKISARFNQPPPKPPPAIAHLFPNVVEAQQKAAKEHEIAKARNPMEKFNMEAITSSMADMDEEGDGPPVIKLGDASVAAPFTSKLSNVSAIANIIRQGRCTLVATIQMYKILGLNCLISAYSLSVLYLEGIKFGDYQVTICGMLMSVCFLCISRAKPIEQLSKQRPMSNIFNFYIVISILLQFGIHIAALLYIGDLCESIEPRSEKVDLDAEFKPSLLNSAIYLISLSQQVSTFSINFQGRPFREGITENSALYYGLAGAMGVAFCGATDFLPELNRWLQVVEMSWDFRMRLTSAMVLDYALAWLIEIVCKYLLVDTRPKPLVTDGIERREARRKLQKEEQEKKRKEEEAAKKESEVDADEKAIEAGGKGTAIVTGKGVSGPGVVERKKR